MGSKLFGHNLRTVQCVSVGRTAGGFAGSDALIVVGKAILKLSIVHGHFHELAAVPGQGITVVGVGVADGVIGRT